ncbi:glycosyltransferase family 2 protein [Gymnodinialimonas sp. 2305UL16-5]|uniref:glycosyltransferase family 2 protein n=1 Tax=Gymnodinialimonas mytili TaxID=3126503 RepID=UPI0030B659FA
MAGAAFSILTMMKDEGPRLLEWLAYHRLIGFDRVWVYSNNCRDGSDHMLDRLDAMGLCRHTRNDVPAGKKPQPHALTLGQKNDALLDTDWLIVMDADEFLHVHAGDGTVKALLAACPDGTEGVAVNWRMMGACGIEDWSEAPLLGQFTHGAPDGFRRGWGVKTLFRPFPDLKLGIHRPNVKGARRDPARRAALLQQRWVNGSGIPMPPGFMAEGWRGSAATTGYALAEIAHFAVQSAEAYLLRGDRGNVNLKPNKYDATYFAIFDRNELARPGLSDWVEPVAAQVADWLRDPDLAQHHAASVRWHRMRRDTLRQAPEWAAHMAALKKAASVPYEDLDTLLFPQPLTAAGKKMVTDMQAKGVPEAAIAKAVSQAVSKLEAVRDAREAAELRAMGITPPGDRTG